MAAQRAPRATAGNRMARVLEEELGDDDFYKTTYGGFDEEEEDNDFHSDQEDSADEVDSDFDNPEDQDDGDEDGEPVDKPKKRKKAPGVVTKAYKEPKKVDAQSKQQTGKDADKTAKEKEEAKQKKAVKRAAEKAAIQDEPMRKSSRRSTAKNSLMTTLREKEREEDEKKKKEQPKKSTVALRRLTQEELLAEAEKTEKKNLKSLENYYKLEASRKKTLTKKKTFDCPTVKMLSVITDVVQPETRQRIPSSTSTTTTAAPDKESRTFYIYSHDDTFEETYPWNKPPSKKVCLKPPGKKICPVTRKLARFTDPLTKIPYYDLTAFKAIREIYRKTLADAKSS